MRDAKTSPIAQFRSLSSMALEQRMLLDGAAVATAADVVADSLDDLSSTEHAAASPALFSSTPLSDAVFIDTSVAGFESLLPGISRNAEIFFIDGSSDGLGQMVAALAGDRTYRSIQVFSHGEAGVIQLGGTTLTRDSVESRAGDLAAVGRALAAEGDLLFFGCDVAATDEGKALIDRLADLTGADVAASTDITGGLAVKGGDWELEYRRGDIQTVNIVDQRVLDAFSSALQTGWTSNGPAYLLNSDNANNDEFGWSSAIADNSGMIAVGGWTQGDIYVYRPTGAGDYVEYKISPAVTGTGGSAVAVDGNFLIIGYGSANQAYIYQWDSGTDTWIQRASLTGSGNFGTAVAIQADGALFRAVVGAPNMDIDGAGTAYVAGQGAACLYYSTNSGTSWIAGTVLGTNDGRWDNELNFGKSVAIDGNKVVVGAPGHGYQIINSSSGLNAQLHYIGRAYVYDWTSGNANIADATIDTYLQADGGYYSGLNATAQFIGNGNTSNGQANFNFGTSVDASYNGTNYLVGVGSPGEAGNGESYVWLNPAAAGATPGATANQVPGLAAGSQFGYSVGVDAYTNKMIVGAWNFGTDDGQVNIYNSSAWGTVETSYSGAADTRFGWSVAIARDTVIIGSPWGVAGGGNRCGALAMYLKNTTQATVADSLTVSEGAAVQLINVLANDTDSNYAGVGGSVATASGGVDMPKVVFADVPMEYADAFSVTTNALGYSRIQFDPNHSSLDYLAFGESVVIPVTYTSADSGGETVNGTLNVTVNGVNDTPALVEAVPLQIVNNGVTNYLFTYGSNAMSPSRLRELGVFIDPDGTDWHSIRFWNGSTAVNTYTPSGGPTFTLNDYVAATYSQTGNTVTVTFAAHGLTAGNTIILDYRTGTGTDKQYTVASVVDANNFTVTEAVSQTTSGNVALLRAPGEITVTGITSGMVGTTYNLLPLRFTDNNGASVTQVVQWQCRVDRSNVAPVATGGTLAVTAWEDNARPGTYSQTGNTVTVTAPSAHGLTPGSLVSLDYLGGLGVDTSYTVATVPTATTFTVTEIVSQTTSGNALFSVSPYIATAGQFTDADSPNEELTYSLVGAPTWVTISPVTGSITLAGSNGDIPTSPASFTVRATDMYLRTADKQVTVTLNPVNDAPALTNSVPFTSAYLGYSTQYDGTTDLKSIVRLPTDLFTDIDLPTSNTVSLKAYVGATEVTTAAGPAGWSWLRFDSTTGRFYSSGVVTGNIYDVITVRVEATDTGSPAMKTDYYFDINLFAPPQNAALVGGAAANNSYGYAVAVSENGLWMAVGEPEYAGTAPAAGDYARGRVSIYRWTGAAWEAAGTLLDPSPANDERFGFSLDLSSDGDRLVVGAPGVNGSRGTVYAFTRSGGAAFAAAPIVNGTHVATDADAGDMFGYAVAINRAGTQIIVGAPGDDAGGTEAGAAYLFNWGTAAQQAKRLPVVDAGEAANAQHYDRFGWSVSFDGNVAAVGAPFDSVGTSKQFNGSVTVLGVGAAAFNGAVIKGSGAADYDMYGWSVSLDAYRNLAGDAQNSSLLLAVGAPADDTKNLDTGAVYLYRWAGISDTVSQAELNTVVVLNPLVPFDGQVYDGFGVAVAVDAGNANLADFNNDVKTNGVRVAVGSRTGGEYAGNAYLFRAKTDWTFLGQAYNQTGVVNSTTAAGNKFGWSVALSNSPTTSYSVWSGTYTVTANASRVVVGAPETDIYTNGNYAQAGTTVTVTTPAAHGLIVGQTIYLDFTNGASMNYDIPGVIATVPTGTTFTVTSPHSLTQAAGATVTYNTMGSNGTVHWHASGGTRIETASGLLSAGIDKWLDGGLVIDGGSTGGGSTVGTDTSPDVPVLAGDTDGGLTGGELTAGGGDISSPEPAFVVDVGGGSTIGGDTFSDGLSSVGDSGDALLTLGYGTQDYMTGGQAGYYRLSWEEWIDGLGEPTDPLAYGEVSSSVVLDGIPAGNAAVSLDDPLLFLAQTETEEVEAAAAAEGEEEPAAVEKEPAEEPAAPVVPTAAAPTLSRQLQMLGDRHARASADFMGRLEKLGA